MSRMSARVMIGAAATASALGLLAGTPPAQSTPMFPLSPACQYQLPKLLRLNQDNNIVVDFSLANNKASGPVQYRSTDPRNAIPTGGKASGALNSDGRTFLFIVNWNEGPGNGLNNNYYGTINDDGSISGWTLNSQNVRNNWTAVSKATCVTPPPAPVPAPATGGTKTFGTATVVADTDIYDKPDGKGQKIGTLFVGEAHPLMEPCRNDWCRVGTIELGGFSGLPNGTAWVYSKGFLTFS